MANADYMHRNISKSDADVLLKGTSDGDFLVRDRKPPTEYILSMTFKGKGTHHLLTKGDDDVWLLNGKDFDVKATSIDELIKGMQAEKRPGWPCLLGKPVPTKSASSSSSAPSAAAPTASSADFDPAALDITKDEAEAIMDKAGRDDGLYLFRSHKGDPNQYILSVVFKGKNTHHLTSREKPGEEFKVNKSTIPDATTLDAVAEHLREKRPFWPVPLVRRIGGGDDSTHNGADQTDGASALESKAEAVQQDTPAEQTDTAAAAEEEKKDEAPPQADTGKEPAEEQAKPASSVTADGCAYHGFITKDQAEELLAGRPDGTFLIRLRKEDAKEEYILSVVFKSKPTHHLLERGDDAIYKLNGTSTDHNTLVDVIEMHRTKHKRWPVPLKKHIPGLAEMPDAGSGVAKAGEPADEPQPQSDEKAAPPAESEETKPAEHEAAPAETKPEPATAEAMPAVPAVPAEESTGAADATTKPQKDAAYASGDMDTPISVHVKSVKQFLEPANDDEPVQADLPHPDFDFEEPTVEPQMSEYFHGDIADEDARKRLEDEPRAVEGAFLFTQEDGDDDTVKLFVRRESGIQQFTLRRASVGEPFFLDGKATGAMTLVQLVEFLSERQAGWADPITEGVKGIKVLPFVDKMRMKAENEAAIEAARKENERRRQERLRKEAEERGRQLQQKTKAEKEEYEKSQKQFESEREKIRQEFLKLRREELKKKKIEERKREMLEKKRKELYAKYNMTDDSADGDVMVEVNFDSSDSESSDDDDEREKEELRAWRRRASAKQFGFSPEKSARASAATIAEDEERPAEDVGDQKPSGRKSSKKKKDKSGDLIVEEESKPDDDDDDANDGRASDETDNKAADAGKTRRSSEGGGKKGGCIVM